MNSKPEPSAPPYSFSTVNPLPVHSPHSSKDSQQPPSYPNLSGTASTAQQPLMMAPAALQPQNEGTSPSTTVTVPPMMYAAPGAVQPAPPASASPVPIAALKPMPHPPPYPSLNEVDLNEDRRQVRCPYCYASITTKTSFRTGTMTHIAAMAVLLVCCPFFWVPYCMECCKDVDHGCPNCGRSIGRFKRFN